MIQHASPDEFGRISRVQLWEFLPIVGLVGLIGGRNTACLRAGCAHRHGLHESSGLDGNRILPAKSWKAAKVSVGRRDGAAVVDCERRQLCVGNQIADRSDSSDQLREDLPIPLGRLWYPDALAIQPLFDLLPRRSGGLRASEHARIGYEPEEGE
jgi:hypothetical protein